MTIKQIGGIFGRNPSFNNVDVEGVLTTSDADINGGSIDGVIIGGSNASAGSFTTLTASDDVNFDSGTFFVDASASTVGIGTTTPPFPLSMAVDSPASDIMIGVGNTKYNSTDSSGESKISFGWSNHGAANIAAYKQTTNLTGFKVYTELGFNTANLALTIDSSGNLIPNGNLVVANGKGIDFSATAGTGTSELFDDYEEGTFTATLTGATTAPTTPVTVTARYVKVGKLVTVNIYMLDKNTTGASGKMQITGLPFTAQGGSVNTGSPLMFGFNVTNKSAVALIGSASSTIVFYSVADDGPWTQEDISAGSSKFLYLSMTYEAA